MSRLEIKVIILLMYIRRGEKKKREEEDEKEEEINRERQIHNQIFLSRKRGGVGRRREKIRKKLVQSLENQKLLDIKNVLLFSTTK